MKQNLCIGLVLVALASFPAFAWEELVGGNRLSCDFVADGIVRVRYALGDTLQENGTGVVTLPRREVTPGTRTRGNLSFSVDSATGRIVFTAMSTGRVLLAESATAPHAGKAVDTSKVVYDDDGITYDCEKGAFTVTTLKWDDAARKLTGGVPGTSVKVL